MCFINIFSQYIVCLFKFSFKEQKFIILIKSSQFFFPLMDPFFPILLVSYLSLLNPQTQRASSFSCYKFYDFKFMFESVIHFELIF